jgi:SAM-dependent methyltransferase
MATTVDGRRTHSRRVFWKYVRRFIPSVAAATRNRFITAPLDMVDYVVAYPFRELRTLPPNRLRLRIGTDQRVLFGQVDHIVRANSFWLKMFADRAVGPESTVLDIGCGCGRTAHMLRDAKYRNAPFFRGRYIGVDVDAEAIAWCRRNFPADRFEFHSLNMFSSVYNPGGDAGEPDLPVAADAVDFVICGSLFTHLLERDLGYYLRQIHRVLRPGGLAYATFFCVDHLRASLGGRFTFAHRMGQAYVESVKYPEAAVAYEEGFLLGSMNDIGFGDVQVEPADEDREMLQSTFLLRK